MINIDKHQALYSYFGYSSFNEGQEQIIDALLGGRDALCVMPTGAGKSLCYQLPAVMQQGTALVISPLIALMKDQVDQLTRSGIKAAYINSSLTPAQCHTVISRARTGEYKILYAAPERLDVPEFVALAQDMDISLVAVDEAHCVSQWGQDFRPSYLRIADFISTLERSGRRPPVCALTATATKRVRGDIIDLLKLRNAAEVLTSFDRPNLCFEVRHPSNKRKELAEILRSLSGLSGIIYCLTTKTVEQLCEYLNKLGISAVPYHGKLPTAQKTQSQNDFIYDRCNVIVATNAFGMGINKSNVSYVIHYNMPRDLESYYQEAGRAGRDGEPARCILLYGTNDIATNRFLMEHTGEDNENMSPEQVEEKQRADEIRLNRMISYCNTGGCLRSFILNYFGEHTNGDCGNCSNCADLASGELRSVETDITTDAQKIISCVVRMARRELRFGKGTIIETLKGEQTEKTEKFHLNELKTFGAMKDSDKAWISELIDHLTREGYLRLESASRTSHATFTVQGPRAMEAVAPDARLTYARLMRKSSGTKKQKENIPVTALPPVMQELFEQLRTLRMTIATDEGVPPYVIFSNSTLREMCVRVPMNDDELSSVSGIGETKLERYGDRFLSVITRFATLNGEKLDEAKKSLPQEAQEEEYVPARAAKTKETRELFSLTDGQRAAIVIEQEKAGVNDIARAMNEQIDRERMKGVTGQAINQWLIEEGLLELVERGGIKQKRPTEQGRQLGITEELHTLQATGQRFMVNMFNERAQRYVVENFR